MKSLALRQVALVAHLKLKLQWLGLGGTEESYNKRTEELKQWIKEGRGD